MVCYFKLLFCEARYCPNHVAVRIRAFDLCRIRLGRGGGFSIALYIHWGVGIFDYSLYCFGLKSWRFVRRRAHYWPNHTGTYVWSLPVHSVNKVRDQMDRIPQCEGGRERRDQRVFPQQRTQKPLFMGWFQEHFGAFSVIFYENGWDVKDMRELFSIFSHFSWMIKRVQRREERGDQRIFHRRWTQKPLFVAEGPNRYFVNRPEWLDWNDRLSWRALAVFPQYHTQTFEQRIWANLVQLLEIKSQPYLGLEGLS